MVKVDASKRRKALGECVSEGHYIIQSNTKKRQKGHSKTSAASSLKSDDWFLCICDIIERIWVVFLHTFPWAFLYSIVWRCPDSDLLASRHVMSCRRRLLGVLVEECCLTRRAFPMNKCPTKHEQMRKKCLCNWLDSGAKGRHHGRDTSIDLQILRLIPEMVNSWSPNYLARRTDIEALCKKQNRRPF